MKQQTMNVRKLTTMALFATIASIVMYFEIPLPFMPPFLKIDFSTSIVLISGYILGPISGVVVGLIKSLVHLTQTQTGGVGELADFIITSTFVLVAAGIYKVKPNKKGMLTGVVLASLSIGLVGVLANMFLLIPFYKNIMPIDAIVSACNAINPMVTNLNGYYLFGALPFNLFKGVILSTVSVFLYTRLNKPGILGEKFSQVSS